MRRNRQALCKLPSAAIASKINRSSRLRSQITHSEWGSSDAFSASAGAGVSGNNAGAHASFKRLPFNFCALSLQPFNTPVCTSSGTIFDHENILSWLQRHGTNPVDGQPLKLGELIKLNFVKNEAGEYVDPVTFKVLTDNTHIVALGNTGNVFAWETVERLNIKGKMWRDLVSDEEFGRKDIITLQDPQNVESRDLSAFKYLKDGVGPALTEAQEKERSGSVNANAMGSAAKILKAKEAVAKAREDRAKGIAGRTSTANGALTKSDNGNAPRKSLHSSKSTPYNAAQHTTGKAAASLTSTGLTPHTGNERAIMTDEEYMLKPKRVKQKGYARLTTTLGDINIELQTEYAPKAVWNFIQLSKRGYYRNIPFHRNIRNFMIQGGDPTGTGKGGQSCWGKNFNDEFDGPLSHNSRGTVSMANKGKNTNSSQFFITYRAAAHLDRKHTIFGKVVEGLDVLSRLENAPTDSNTNRPLEKLEIVDVVVFVDPFEEFLKQKSLKDEKEKEMAEVMASGGTEDDRTTWTGKRIRADGKVEAEGGVGVGKYLKAAMADEGDANGGGGTGGVDQAEWEQDVPEEPVRKKAKATGGFGNFDSW